MGAARNAIRARCRARGGPHVAADLERERERREPPHPAHGVHGSGCADGRPSRRPCARHRPQIAE
eukprot:9541231-Lingulodinium_polyedra.AAC.1